MVVRVFFPSDCFNIRTDKLPIEFSAHNLLGALHSLRITTAKRPVNFDMRGDNMECTEEKDNSERLLYGTLSEQNDYTREDMPLTQYYDGKKIVLPISDDAMWDMYKHWIHQGLSGLMSTVGLAKCQKLNEYYKRRFFTCSQNSNTIYDHSRCVNDVMVAEERLKLSPLRTVSGRQIKNRIFRSKSSKLRKTQPHHNVMLNRWIGSFQVRFKRMVAAKAKADYTLRTSNDHLTAFGMVAKSLMKMVRNLKKKNSSRTLESVMDDMQQSMEKIRLQKKVRKMMRDRITSVYQSRAQFNKTLTHGPSIEKDEQSEIGDFDALSDTAKTGKDDINQQILRTQMQFVKRVVELAKSIEGGNGSSTDIGLLKIASPRFLSITPEGQKSESSTNLLSPSIFSLHDKGKGLEALLSVPNAMKSVDNADYRQWMDLIVEASGVPDIIERVNKEQIIEVAGNYDDAPRGIDGQPMHFSKENATEILGDFGRRQIELFEQLQANFTEKQQKDFKDTGYSILSREQMEQVYGEQSPYNDSAALQLFKSLSETQIRRRLEINLQELAKAERPPIRAKRQAGQGIILSPIVLTAFILNPTAVSQPLILSPVAIAPLVLSPAIFGAVILSPWVLVPVILSPRLLSPTILSPVTLATAVLSPLAFNPFILSAGAIVPFVLSPLLLDPFILSPQVLTPVVLCPLALSPFIFNPTLLSPLILSPFVLSPLLFSPVYVTALVLSPHALSPLINSTGKYVALIMSPSILS
ncbi:hypothetical protein Tcan_12897 [Toxocara canis]|uniref:Serum response factor-binding protein 1 n=1 Tax=Toxocara canis TaxID=6265 RepID=A0A0B2W4T4_TOXCA|nr:hypothetical protein Tcan_12897 [Toxocara canis]